MPTRTKTPTMEAALKVKHDGQAKMVGKVYTRRETKHAPLGPRLIFLHEEVKGDQAHRALGSPGGIDTCVLDVLVAAGVTHVYHYRRQQGVLYIARVGDMVAHGIRSQRDGRDRKFLPFASWDEVAYRDFHSPFISHVVEIDPAVPTQEQIVW